ncbi:MAG: PD-(D/E)XK nuclease family protein [Fidelibacterota bacterium]
MTNLKIVSHPVSSDLNRHITKTVSDDIQEGRKVAFLLPSARHILRLKETLISKNNRILPGQLFFGNYLAWAKRTMDVAQRAYRIIGAGEEWLLLFDFLKKNRSLFPSLKPGTLALIREVVTELQETGLSRTELSQLPAVCPDLAPFIDCLLNGLRTADERHLCSSATLLLLFSERLCAGAYQPSEDLLLVAGFYEFNPIQRKILNCLIDCYPVATVYYPIKDDHPALRFVKPVEEIIDRRDYSMETMPAESARPLSKIAAGLYRSNPMEADINYELLPQEFCNDWSETALILLRCPNRHQEVNAAAQTVKKWIADGLRADKIAVAFRGSYDYRKLIRLIFPTAGIPVKRDAQLLSETTPLRIVQKIFDVNERDFCRASLIDLTRFEAIRRFYGETIIQKFEYRSGTWGLSFSRESWLNQLTQRQEFLRTWINENDESLKERNILRQELLEIDELLPVLQRLLEDISLPKQACWADYLMIVQQLVQKYDPDDGADIIRALQEVFRHLNSLVDDHETVQRRNFIMAFNNLMMNTTVPDEGIQERSDVTIGNVMDLRGERFDGIILLGMIDGEFPVNRRENPLLNGSQRKTVNQTVGRTLLKPMAVDVLEDKFLFFSLVNRTDVRMLITYPQFDNTGRVLAPSPFLDDCLLLVNHSELKQVFRYCAVSPAEIVPAVDRSVSERDLLLNRWLYPWDEAGREFLDSRIERWSSADIPGRMTTVEKRKQRIRGPWNGVLSSSRFREWCFRSPLSVTRLQQYAWCPFLYLCQYLWKIDAAEEPLAEVSALSDGVLIHALFEKFMTQADTADYPAWSRFISGDLESEINTVLASIRKKYRSAFGYIDDAVWNKKMTDLRRGLDLFIEHERAILDSGCLPEKFELQFSLNFPLISGDRQIDVPFQVKIDRVDRHPGGGVVILEYKRSAKATHDPVKGLREGVYFQLPFYLLAYRQQYAETRFAGVYSYIFNEGRVAKALLTEPLFDRIKPQGNEVIEELLRQTREKVTELLQRLSGGDFFLDPHDLKQRCHHGVCPYYEVCRIDTRHVETNDDSEI